MSYAVSSCRSTCPSSIVETRDHIRSKLLAYQFAGMGFLPTGECHVRMAEYTAPAPRTGYSCARQDAGVPFLNVPVVQLPFRLIPDQQPGGTSAIRRDQSRQGWCHDESRSRAVARVDLRFRYARAPSVGLQQVQLPPDSYDHGQFRIARAVIMRPGTKCALSSDSLGLLPLSA